MIASRAYFQQAMLLSRREDVVRCRGLGWKNPLKPAQQSSRQSTGAFDGEAAAPAIGRPSSSATSWRVGAISPNGR